METVLKDIESFRENLWKLVERNSKGLSHIQIVRSLETITDNVYGEGIDRAYEAVKLGGNSFIMANVWDCMWLAAWIKELRRLQIKK